MQVMIRTTEKTGREVISGDKFLDMLRDYHKENGNLIIPIYYVQDGYELGSALYDVLCRKVSGTIVNPYTRAKILGLIGDSMEELKKYYSKLKSYNGIII